MTSPLRPSKKIAQLVMPEVARPRPAPVARALQRPDEMSVGRGRALRVGAQTRLGSGPFSADVAGQVPAGTFRVNALGTLQTGDTTVSPTRAALVSDDKRDEAADILLGPANPSALANALRDAADDPELRRALIAEAFASGQADAWLNGEVFTDSRRGQVNEGYDDLTEVANATAEAYRAGDITDEQLRELAEDLGPERAAVFVQTLALGTNASGNGGVVEAFGEQAEALGFDQAAALAFTSNDVLLQEHYPTAEAQREAFGHLEEFIERYDDDEYALESFPVLRNALGSAVVNAARLTANGNGWSQEQLDEELRELGPTLTGEIIAQAGERLFNEQADGPLDVLGDSATRVAAGAEGDDQEAWQLNAAIAYTQSPALIEANLGTEEARHAAFDAINGYLADSRGEWSLAERDGYSLVRGPQAVEGLNRLLGTHPEMITELLDSGAEGEADLVQLFESISLIPGVPQQLRDQLQRTVEGYVADQLASVEPGNANEVGERIGKLLGTLQVASNRAVSSAEAGDTQVRDLALDLAAGIAGAAAEVALTGVAGPLGAAIGGTVVSAVLGSMFENDPPSQSEIEDAFVDRMKEAGIDVSAGERGHDTLTELYRELQDALVEQLAQLPEGDPRRDEVQLQIELAQGVLNGLDTFGDTLDSGEDAGDLNVILNDRGDEP